MSVEFVRWLQSRLVAHGQRLVVDGAMGPATRSAIEEFQIAKNLAITSTANPATVTALRMGPDGASISRPAKVRIGVPWLEEARRRMGLHEVRNRSALMAWLRSDGHTLGDPAKLPWCGDFVETCIRLALPDEPVPANPYWAKNWLKFGRETKGREGAVAIFGRSGGAHVSFYTGEDDATYHVIGGNQSNRVSETRIAKSRLLGFRWPETYDLDTAAVSKAANGVISINES